MRPPMQHSNPALDAPFIQPDEASAHQNALEVLAAVPPAALVVAAGQAPCAALDIAANTAVAAELVRQAAGRGAHLLVLPELFLTGYELSSIVADPDTYTVAPNDRPLDALSAACAETRTAVVIGAPTRDQETGSLRISVLALDITGTFAARYDKQHVDSSERMAGFTAGMAGCTLTLNGWRLGLAICWDASFPEHARAAALDGCHAYLVGAMFPGSRGDFRRTTICPARALDNAMYVVAANHCGSSGPYDGCGGSALWDPEGRLLADAGDGSPGLATARLDPDVLARIRADECALLDPSRSDRAHPRGHFMLD